MDNFQNLKNYSLQFNQIPVFQNSKLDNRSFETNTGNNQLLTFQNVNTNSIPKTPVKENNVKKSINLQTQTIDYDTYHPKQIRKEFFPDNTKSINNNIQNDKNMFFNNPLLNNSPGKQVGNQINPNDTFWKTLIKHQGEIAQKQLVDDQLERSLQKKKYKLDLDNLIQAKNMINYQIANYDAGNLNQNSVLPPVNQKDINNLTNIGFFYKRSS